MKKETPSGILIDPDVLFDTRLTMLYDFSPSVFKDVLKTKKYMEREFDSFGPLSIHAFKRIYGLRNVEVLKNSIPAMIRDMLHEYTMEACFSSMESGGSGEVIVYVDFSKYDLSLEDKKLFMLGIENITYQGTVVKEISHNDDLKWMNEHIDLIIKYDGLEWLNALVRTKKIVYNPIPEVMLVCPKLLGSSRTKEKTAFDNILKGTAPFIKLNFIPIKYFNGVG